MFICFIRAASFKWFYCQSSGLEQQFKRIFATFFFQGIEKFVCYCRKCLKVWFSWMAPTISFAIWTIKRFACFCISCIPTRAVFVLSIVRPRPNLPLWAKSLEARSHCILPTQSARKRIRASHELDYELVW